MAPHKGRNVSAEIKFNWNISDIRHALPIQLRPPKHEALDAAVVAALHSLSMDSRGKIQQIHHLLREAVLTRHKRSQRKTKGNVITVEDVQAVHADWNGKGRKRARSVEAHDFDAFGRRDFLKRVKSTNTNGGVKNLLELAEELTDPEEGIVGKKQAESSCGDEQSAEEIVIPETPPHSSSSFMEASSPTQESITARIQRLNNEAKEHRRLQEQFLARATEHGEKALRRELRIKTINTKSQNESSLQQSSI